MAILYKISFPDGKNYFGVTKFALHRRMRNHAHVARAGAKFPVSEAIRKFGIENCVAETLVVAEKPYLLELEKRAILAFNSAVPFGYNAYIGSELSASYSRCGANNGMFGKRHSDATKQKISKRRMEK